MQLDQVDKDILRLLQQNARLTSDQIAEHIDLSASAVQRRLKRLRETAVESEIAILSPKAIGSHLTIIVDIEFEDENSRLLHDFKTLMKSRPEVLQCYQTAGRTDFVVIVVVQDIEEYNTFAEACFLTNSNLKRYQTNVVLDRVKIGFQYPI